MQTCYSQVSKTLSKKIQNTFLGSTLHSGKPSNENHVLPEYSVTVCTLAVNIRKQSGIHLTFFIAYTLLFT